MTRSAWWSAAALAFVLVIPMGFAGLALAEEGVAVEPAPDQQEPKKEPQEAPPPETIRPDVVEEVTVTAQKREEDVQEVPISISTVVGTDFVALTSGGPDIRVLSARVPSLLLESSFGRAFPRFYMRGLGNTDFDLNASQPVSMVVDEIVLENPVVKGMPLFDLDRVEILRGPQGTLFGRNTPAGVIKFETKKPSQQFESNFRVSYGTFGNVDVTGGIGGAITKTLSARFSVLYQSESDWVDNEYRHKEDELGGYTTKAYRLQLLWEPTEHFKGLLNVHGWDLDGTARIFRANIIKKGTNDLVSGFDQEKVWFDGQNKQEIDAKGALLRLEYDFGPAVLTSITGYENLDMYSRGDIDGGYSDAGHPPSGPGFIPFSSESADGLPTLDQITEELRLASPSGGKLDWIVGVFYFNERLKADTFSYDSLTPGNPQNGYSFQRQEADASALFGSVDYRISDQWSVKAGLRYSKDKKDFKAERPQPTFQSPTVAPIRKETDDSKTNWDLSTTYKLSENVNLYGRIATGYRASSIQGRILFCADFEGGTNPDTNCVFVADPEDMTSAEVGIKTILADQRLRLNFAVYDYEVKGQQITAVGGKYNIATLLNADKTQGYGFESELEYILSGNAWANLGLSYNHTEIKDKNLYVAPCGGGCTVTDPIVTGKGAVVDGNPLPHAPEWIFNGMLNYQSDPFNRGIFASFDWAYYSEKSFFLYESKEFRGDGLTLGLRAGYGWDAGKYEVAIFARNLADTVIVEGGIDFDNLTGMTNEPRIIGLEFVAHL